MRKTAGFSQSLTNFSKLRLQNQPYELQSRAQTRESQLTLQEEFQYLVSEEDDCSMLKKQNITQYQGLSQKKGFQP